MNKNELDKIAAEALPPLPEEELQKAAKEMINFFSAERNNYLMLLSKENNYYTFFDLTKTPNLNPTDLVSKILEFITTDDYLLELGPIKHIETHLTYIEIWIGNIHFAVFESSALVVTL